MGSKSSRLLFTRTGDLHRGVILHLRLLTAHMTEKSWLRIGKSESYRYLCTVSMAIAVKEHFGG